MGHKEVFVKCAADEIQFPKLLHYYLKLSWLPTSMTVSTMSATGQCNKYILESLEEVNF